MQLLHCSMCSFTLMISAYVSQSRWVNVNTAIIFISVTVSSVLLAQASVVQTFYTGEVAFIWRILLGMMPWIHFIKIFQDILSKTGYEGAMWNDEVDGFSIGDLTKRSHFQLPPVMPTTYISPLGAMGYLVLVSIVYNIFTWYFAQVFSGGSKDSGASLRPWFPFMPEYWGWTKKPQREVLDADTLRRLQKISLEEDLIVLHKLSKSYRTSTALKEVSLRIHPGEITALLGSNGAGKTTLVNILAGLHEPSHGEAYLFGLSVREDLQTLRQMMGNCPQHDVLWPQLTGREHLALYTAFKCAQIQPHHSTHFNGPALSGFASEQAHSDGTGEGAAADGRLVQWQYPPWDRQGHAAELLDIVGLTNDGDEAVTAYSGGMRRRLSLALACVGHPRVMYLDEPYVLAVC